MPADATAIDDLAEEPDVPRRRPEGDEFERGLQSLVSDELPPGRSRTPPASCRPSPATGLSDVDSVPGAFGGRPAADAPPSAPEATPGSAEEAPVAAATEAAVEPPRPRPRPPAELTAAGLVRRTPKKRSEDAAGGGMPMMAARTTSSSQRSPEEVRKMLSRYRSGLNKGRGSADGASTDTPES